MRLRLLYLYRNLTRNPLRTLLTCAAVALPIVIYVLSTAVVHGVDKFLETAAEQLRLAVTQKSSIVNPLPIGYRSKIRALDPTGERIVSVCGLRWIGGQVENSSVPLSTLAVEHDTFVQTFPEYHLTADEIEAWQRDRQAIVVGRATAGQLGWKVGDRITIRPSTPPYTPMEFHIISTAPQAEDPITNLLRFDYLQDELQKVGQPADWVNLFFVKCASKSDLDYYRTALDEHFAHSQDETRTQDEKAFTTEYINQQFNLPRNLTILSAATVFVAIMAAANTMSMSFRDRTHEFATLKSMGFGPRFAFLLIQSESLLLCAVGGIVGAAVPYIAFVHTPLKDFVVPIIVHLEIDPIVCVKAVLISLFIGVAAAVWPSWLVVKLKVVEALRSLE